MTQKKINYSTDDNLDIDDLEEKIRVDKEPSWINNCMLDYNFIYQFKKCNTTKLQVVIFITN